MHRGSCMCGKVAYELKGPPLFMYYCHCTTCRKATGTTFATNVIAATKDFVVTRGQDQLSSFESSPNKRPYFCSNCGSPIYSHAEASKDIVSIRAGTFEGALPIRPTVHAYAAEKAPWFDIQDGLKQHPAAIS